MGPAQRINRHSQRYAADGRELCIQRDCQQRHSSRYTVDVSWIIAAEPASYSPSRGNDVPSPTDRYVDGTTFNVGAGATVTIDAGTFTGGAVFNLDSGAVVDIIGTPSFAGTLTGSGSGTVQVSDHVSTWAVVD